LDRRIDDRLRVWSEVSKYIDADGSYTDVNESLT